MTMKTIQRQCVPYGGIKLRLPVGALVVKFEIVVGSGLYLWTLSDAYPSNYEDRGFLVVSDGYTFEDSYTHLFTCTFEYEAWHLLEVKATGV